MSIIAPCIDGEMSLYSGISSRYGNVRICINGTWSKICGYGDSVVDDNLASVICSELGHSEYGDFNNINLISYYIFIIYNIWLFYFQVLKAIVYGQTTSILTKFPMSNVLEMKQTFHTVN